MVRILTIRSCRIHWARRTVSIIVMLLTATAVAHAQPASPFAASETTAEANSPVQQSEQTAGSSQAEKKKEDPDKEQRSGSSNDRLFWTLPNFLTVENMDHVPPLTARQKFSIVSRTSLDWVQ